MDYLEREWYDKLISIGMSSMDATLLAKIKAAMERDLSIVARIKQEGFSGFCRWVEIHCRDIYESVKGALTYAWQWLKGQF